MKRTKFYRRVLFATAALAMGCIMNPAKAQATEFSDLAETLFVKDLIVIIMIVLFIRSFIALPFQID